MQQINLYLPEFRPNREPLRAIHMAWGLLAFFVLLIGVSIYTSFQEKDLQQRLEKERKLQQTMQLQLQTLSAQRPAQASADLDAQITLFQNELQRRQQILAMISSNDLGNDKGFSAQLIAMAQASLTTISIESFSLQQGGTYAELTGKTRSADQIPLYLQRLRNDPVFAHVGFGVLNVGRDKNTNGLLKFSLARFNEETSSDGDSDSDATADSEKYRNEKVNELLSLTRYKQAPPAKTPESSSDVTNSNSSTAEDK